ncbi:hypothetical protein MVEG_00071 [Podila verticillata NRRL 6337]|nr:hypothetical protein MVEG_00071 [Podila verticillata NRRL 6337]
MLLIKSVLVLCSAVAVLAQRHAYAGADAVASSALFFGEDTTESLDPLKIFKDPINHATAASSILAFSAEKTGFKPSEKSAESLADTLPEFMKRISTFPGFILVSSSESAPVQLKDHTTAEEFENKIRFMFGGDHSGKIAFKLAELLPLDLDYEEATRLKNWILGLVVIDKPMGSDKVSIQLVSMKLSIAFDKEPKTCSGPTPTPEAYIPEQGVKILVSKLDVNSSFLTAYAESLVGMLPIVDVEHMIALLTSPARNGPKPEDLLSLWGSQQKVFSF